MRKYKPKTIRTCPKCESPDTSFVSTSAVTKWVKGKGVTVTVTRYKCNSCGHGFTE